MLDRYSSWPLIVHMLSVWPPLFLYLHMNGFLCYLASIMTIRSADLRYYDFLRTSSSVFLWWFLSARAINITAARYMWLLSGFVYCDFHMPPMRWVYYFWGAPCISTQAQVGISSCLIFLVIFDHGSSNPGYGFNASGSSSLIKVFCL